ncbi:hypothetical protein STANM309S_04636 [Streptomyces tanashiensis]
MRAVADLLRVLGPLTDAELAERGAEPGWAPELGAARRAIRVRIGGRDHWAAIEDAGRLRDALGTALPVGVPEAFTEPVKDPLGDLLARFSRTHGPFTSSQAAARFGLGAAVTDGALQRLSASGGPSRASSIPPASARSGATRRSCAGCGTVPWRPCATSWSRFRRRPSPPSCRSGSIWEAAACAASTASRARSSSSRAHRSRPRPWRS